MSIRDNADVHNGDEGALPSASTKGSDTMERIYVERIYAECSCGSDMEWVEGELVCPYCDYEFVWI